MVTVHKCKECGQTYLSWNEFDAHVNRDLQKSLPEDVDIALKKRAADDGVRFSDVVITALRKYLELKEKGGIKS